MQQLGDQINPLDQGVEEGVESPAVGNFEVTLPQHVADVSERLEHLPVRKASNALQYHERW